MRPKRQKIVNLTTPLEDMTSEYIGQIGVGTGLDGEPQFSAHVVFDTGSTNLWVASVLCQSYPCSERNSSAFYDPARSTTQEPYALPSGEEPKDIDITFGTGELRGPLHVDTYRVGPLTVPRQPFAMIREMHGQVFRSFPFEGILGLGFRSLSFGGVKPFFERVIDQKLLTHNEFAFYLNADGLKQSAILWGGVDKSLYHGPIHMFPVVQPHYWSLDLVDFRIGNVSVAGAGSKRVRRLIVDSGTTYFTAPSDHFRLVSRRLAPTSCHEVELNSEEYPPLVFVLRDVNGKLFELEVTQETYMLGDASGGGEGSPGTCRPAFMLLDVAQEFGPAMILGEVFMRYFFTVFSRGSGDPSQAKVGFARARIGADPKNSLSFLQPAEQAAMEEDTRSSHRRRPSDSATWSLPRHWGAMSQQTLLDAR